MFLYDPINMKQSRRHYDTAVPVHFFLSFFFVFFATKDDSQQIRFLLEVVDCFVSFACPGRRVAKCVIINRVLLCRGE